MFTHGRWQHATQRVSPNCEPRPNPQDISLIVLHNISLAPFEYGSDAVERLFTNRIDETANPFFTQLVNLRVSAHFFVRRDGEVLQFVSCDEMAYHAGVSQFHGRERCNHFSIGIELEGCDFEPFTAAQYDVLLILLRDLCQHYPITAITGHQHIAPNRKTDPGHFFDWQRLQNADLPVDFNFQAA
ncbi:1,6-anhydro-N-acetylmuramyl-L-alanine amidase AmpD [Alysiella crassa]|uniref:1,6-anhydro-N-acetylmuramyl-L-alanine amidase AmpD n=1 Tax=Alysiella crassa TaxID=153491 RepID=A0A376BM46_9NEIS|nr:1,6-anhydro-N-acetylmuramyl-L-alanine amidase AmpD [Alysiella crassa]UOP07128.1 1,6-anhydro-N-acetylmuramyl-L-alanine amidase AmpD [Alysiella crassa]SSY70715.1 1,6-anhydro-N-acetylmuramyl-L-alanine amidase AmpD [Alysiella crassa]